MIWNEQVGVRMLLWHPRFCTRGHDSGQVPCTCRRSLRRNACVRKLPSIRELCTVLRGRNGGEDLCAVVPTGYNRPTPPGYDEMRCTRTLASLDFMW